MSFDLDHFKIINDTYGHAIGDLVLSACAEVCRHELREADIVGRIGGEEFSVLLPFTALDEAHRVADRLRDAIQRIFIPSPKGPVRVTASFGIAGLDHSVRKIDELLQRADAALYAAKAAGRNTCSTWQAVAAAQVSALRRVLKAGHVVFNSGRSTIDCTVRALSDKVASLDLIGTAAVPEHFKLAIPADGVHRACRVTERSERRIEVAFD